MPKKKSNDEFLQELKDKNISYIPLEEYIKSSIKIKWLCSRGHIFENTPNEILMGKGCPYCSGRYPIVGETDLWTTHPEIAKMLKNSEDGYTVSYGSHKILEWVCPKCGTIKNDSPNNVYRKGLACRMCSDGISYPEKFMICVFSQLNIDFKRYNIFEWSDGKIYDFYLPDYNMIIETHGIQHYIDSKFSYSEPNRTLEEEQFNDKYKEQLAILNGIEHYVQLDCRESTCEYISKSIVNSILAEIFDLSVIEWEHCDVYALNSLAIKIADLWNSGYNTNEICDNLRISQPSVLKYLKKMTKLGLCSFDSQEVHIKANIEKLGKKVICVETGKIYPSIGSVAEDGFIPSRVSMCCNKKAMSHKKMHWEFYEGYKEVS